MQDQAETPAENSGPGDVTVVRGRRNTGRRLHGAIANKLGTAILSGKYKPGDTLSGEIAFAEALDVSRAAYREAIQVLTAKGLVESRPKSGTQVLPRARWNLLDPDVLGWAFAEQAPDPSFVRSLFQLRRIVEPAAAALAAQYRDKDDLKALRSALAEMSRHTLASEAGRSADRDFHAAVLTATRNELLVVLTSSIGAAVNLTTFYKQRSRELPRNPIPDHRRVYQTIADGDPEAAHAAMLVLIDLALADTENAMND